MKHLYDEDAINNDQIDITGFLKGLWQENSAEAFNNLNRIRTALWRMDLEGFATYVYFPNFHTLNSEHDLANGKGKYRADLNNTEVKIKITVKGYDYIVEELRKRQQDDLNSNIIATNISLQDANNSTQDLNAETKKYFKKANNSTRAIVALTSIGALIALISAVISIIALTSNHKQFIIETTPYLQIDDISDSLKPGQPVTVYYKILNLGKDQAKLISGDYGIFTDTSCDLTPFETHPDFKPKPIILNSYSIKESPYKGIWTAQIPLDLTAYDGIMNKKYFIFFFAKIKYINLVTGQPRLYYFNVQIYQQPKWGVQFLYNENADSKK